MDVSCFVSYELSFKRSQSLSKPAHYVQLDAISPNQLVLQSEQIQQ